MKTETINVAAGESFKVHGEHTGQTVEGPAIIVILKEDHPQMECSSSCSGDTNPDH